MSVQNPHILWGTKRPVPAVGSSIFYKVNHHDLWVKAPFLMGKTLVSGLPHGSSKASPAHPPQRPGTWSDPKMVYLIVVVYSGYY